MLTDVRVMSIDELKAFLASSDVLTFKGSSREETYAWIELSLRTYGYLTRPRSEKGLIRSYMQKITGISASQLTRLIRQFRCTRRVRVHPYKRHCFPVKYTREDQLLLAEVDNAHERLSGKATAAILKREYELFGKQQFNRLSVISVAHLYRLRQSSFYLNRTLTIK